MWPKRKILLLVPPDRDEWQGILSLLNVLHRDVIVKTISKDAQVDWADSTVLGLEEEQYKFSEVGPTEILYWPGTPEEDLYRQWGFSQGLMQTELTEFLHRYWDGEIILPVMQSQGEDELFLWDILDSSGFDPSLLWQNREGQWDVRIGNGLHWIIPENWFTSCWGHEAFGCQPKLVRPDCRWVRQGEQVEFYSDKDGFEYLGLLRPYHVKAQEDRIYTIVLQALQLGVPWRSVQRAYDAQLKGLDKPSTRENIRWYANDVARDEGTGRVPIPSEETEYMANRGVG